MLIFLKKVEFISNIKGVGHWSLKLSLDEAVAPFCSPFNWYLWSYGCPDEDESAVRDCDEGTVSVRRFVSSLLSFLVLFFRPSYKYYCHYNVLRVVTFSSRSLRYSGKIKINLPLPRTPLIVYRFRPINGTVGPCRHVHPGGTLPPS